MDGPTSRMPSSSVPTIRPAGHQITKEPYKSAPVTPNVYIDPPRPAKEGCEWVWFPAGYWAEREIAESPGKVMKHFKWRKRSGKSSSGWDTQDGLEHSTSSLWDHISKTSQPLASLFPSEESYSRSYQGHSSNRHGTSSESGKSLFPLNRATQSPLPSPYLTEEAHVQSLQRSPQGLQGNKSSISFYESARPPQSSPLTIISGDSDSATPLATSMSQPPSTSRASASFVLHSTTTIPGAKPRRSLLSRLLPNYKPKVKKMHSDNYAYDYKACETAGAQTQRLSHRRSHSAMPLMSRVASLLGKESKRPRSFKLFGRSPWHRKASAGSEVSASSSIRDVLRGRTPITSPASYIEPVTPSCVQFPGGEATRIQTPPLRDSGHHATRPQSFFFDISSPPTYHGSGYSDNGEHGPSSCSAPPSPPTAERNSR
ncbi:hypothetical protein F4811DRAFT_512323 [Daldinia bambusicola]|nr:hypothetical protein F4811DRAFT_512323 [Daldinia bambusicola]